MNDYIFNFEDLPSTNTPYNSATFEAMQKKLLDSVYPIGRGFIDFTNTDYSNYLGFTWERELVGLTPVGYNANDTDFNQIGKTGGEKTHKLVVSELPNIWGSIGFHGAGSATMLSGAEGVFIKSTLRNKYTYGQESSGAESYDGFSLNFGNNQPHNNMQPYKVVAYWKRVS